MFNNKTVTVVVASVTATIMLTLFSMISIGKGDYKLSGMFAFVIERVQQNFKTHPPTESATETEKAVADRGAGKDNPGPSPANGRTKEAGEGKKTSGNGDSAMITIVLWDDPTPPATIENPRDGPAPDVLPALDPNEYINPWTKDTYRTYLRESVPDLAPAIATVKRSPRRGHSAKAARDHLNRINRILKKIRSGEEYLETYSTASDLNLVGEARKVLAMQAELNELATEFK